MSFLLVFVAWLTCWETTAYPSIATSTKHQDGRRDVERIYSGLQEVVSQALVRTTAVGACALVKQGILGDPADMTATTAPTGTLSSFSGLCADEQQKFVHTFSPFCCS